MKIGNLSESALKRSVLKQLKTKREEIINGAGVGEDCAIFSLPESDAAVMASAVCDSGEADAAAQALLEASNNVAAGGGIPFAAEMTLLLPDEAEEAFLKEMMCQAEKMAEKLSVQICGGETRISGAVNRAVVSVVCLGRKAFSKEGPSEKKGSKARPGQDVVMTKWAGLKGTVELVKKEKEKLFLRYPAYLLEDAEQFEQFYSVIPEAVTARKCGVTAMHDAAFKGLFAALWEFAEKAGVGLEIDLKKIPLRQETVEICNLLDANPYQIPATGSLLLAAENGYDLARTLEAEGIAAAVIGKVTGERDRVVINEEERRYLEPPRN